jgi:gliding-associated putative ABC transporter substrate-binding component GldG
MPWIFFPLTSGTDHPISKNLDPVILRYASSIDFVGLDTTKRRIALLLTSGNTGIRRAPARVDYRFVDLPAEFSTNPQDPNSKAMVAALVEGNFKSAFKNKLLPDGYAKDPDAINESQSLKPSKVLLVGDADLVTTRYDSLYSKTNGEWEYRPTPFDEFKYDPLDPYIASGKNIPKFFYGNGEFLLNAVDYVMGDEAVLGVRSRKITIKPLNENKIKDSAKFWQVLNVGLPLLLIIVIGLVMTFVRRARYAN